MTTVAVYDFETTGLDAESCEIIEVGIVLYNDWEPTEYNWLVRPSSRLPKKIIEITGITDELLQREGQPLTRVAAESWRIFSSVDAWCAHNDDFDIAFLRQHIKPLAADYFEPARIDTLKLADRWFPKRELKSRSLGALAQHFGHRNENAHRATDDARVTGQVLKSMCEMFDVTLEQLVDGSPLPIGEHMWGEDPFEAMFLGHPGPYSRQRNF